MGNGARPVSLVADAEKAVMFTELTLTHACEQTIAWSAGAYLDRKGRAITHCPTCGRWLGEPFLRIEEGQPLVRCGAPRRHKDCPAPPLQDASQGKLSHLRKGLAPGISPYLALRPFPAPQGPMVGRGGPTGEAAAGVSSQCPMASPGH